MKMLREWLGGSEILDLDTPEGWNEFCNYVVQDEELAEHYVERLSRENSLIVNGNESEFIERWSVAE